MKKIREVDRVINYILDEARKFLNNPNDPNHFEALLNGRFGLEEAKRLRMRVKRK